MRNITMVLFLFLALFFMIEPAMAGTFSTVPEVTRACEINPQGPGCEGGVSTTSSNTASSSKMENVLGGPQTKINSKQLISITQNIMVAGNTMAQRFIPFAWDLTAILAGIAFVWLGIMIMLSQADIWHMGLRPLFTLMYTVVFALFLLKAYASITESVVDGFLFAATVLVGGSGGGSVVGTVFGTFQSHFFLMINFMTQVMDKSVITGAWYDVIADIGEDFFNFFIDMMAIGTTILISGILFILFIVLYMTYQIVVAIAIAVGPVFIPFLVLPVTRSLFEGWVKMLIMSGIYLMTSTVIVGLVGTAMDTYFANMGAPTQGGVFLNYAIYVELIILEFVSILALLKTHEFAHAIGGNVSIGGINPSSAIVGGLKKVATGGMG